MAKSIVQNEKSCFLCGKTSGLQRHHCMGGTGRRKLSEEDGLTIYLCHQCHELVHRDRAVDLIVKKIAQTVWEEHFGSREDFIKRYSKSWMED